MPQNWVERLTGLGRAVRDEIIGQRGEAGLDRPVAFEGGDTIYEIDRRVEPLIIEHAERWGRAFGAVVVVCEGLGDRGVRVFGSGEPSWRVLIDPIDGTRNIMYDKRSAWFLATASPERHELTRLSDAVASVVIELPGSKADRADEFACRHVGPLISRRVSLTGGGEEPLPISPSGAADLRHGWAQVSNFFPGTKVLASELMERILTGTLGSVRAGEALVFDDQYLTTGGQLVELMCGRDRFCCDMRPIMFEIIKRRGGHAAEGLCCHPYDIAGLLIAKRAGVIVTDAFGRDLDAPFAVDHPVHWCGYANESLRGAIEPILGEWLSEHGIEAS